MSFWNQIAILAVAGAFASGCYTKPQLTLLVPTDVPLANYTIGETKRAAPGAVMVERVEGTLLLPGYLPLAPLKVEGLGAQPPQEQSIWPARYRYRGTCLGGEYLVTNAGFYREVIGIVIAADGSITCDKPVVQIRGSKAGRSWSIAKMDTSKLFSPKPFVAGTDGRPLRWQLLYSGRSGSEVLLDYREFEDLGFGSQARTAFYQQIKYDLSASKTIQFRETQIEVLEASNAGIRYKVLRDARKAQKQDSLWDEQH